MARIWGSLEYEEKVLDELISRVKRDNDIKTWSNEKKKAIIQKEIYECYNDCVYFIENFLVTDKNPWFFSERIKNPVPFLLFDYQVKTVDKTVFCIENWERLFIEKSRQLWVSWLFCAVALWGFLFKDWKILFLSQKEDYVDKIWDMQSLFEKIRFMVRYLPKWMLPTGFTIEKHMPRLRIIKPTWFWTWSIVWESANVNAWTWWTYKFVFMDEMSKMDNASSINTSIQATTGCIIYNSTPLWKFNEYYRMRCLAIKGKMEFCKLHWSLNPFYTKEWYEWRTKSMTPEQIAQELEINYDVSVAGRVYPRFANIPIWDCKFYNFDYDPYLPLFCSIDNSHWWNDNHAIILAQTSSNWFIKIIDSLQLPSFTTIDECASLLSKQPKWKFDDEAMYFLDRYKNYKTPIFIADPYDTKSTWNDTSIIKIYRNYWITLNVPDRTKTIKERIRLCQINMWRIEVNVNTEDAESFNWLFVSCVQNARYPERNENSQSTSENITPIHDHTSHFRTSFEYLINYLIEQEENMWIVWGIRQREREKVLVAIPDHITWEIKYEYQ